MSITLECFHCFNQYNSDETTAQTKYMFCSVECENAEDARLKEGNQILENAQQQNPLFEQEQKQQNLKHMNVSGILNFVKKGE